MNNNESAILAQKTVEQERKLGLRWLVGLSSIPLFGIVAAFGIAPQTDSEPVAAQTITQNLTLPEITLPSVSDASYWREERIQRGDTVGSLLSRLHVNSQDSQRFMKSSHDTAALYQLIPGKTIRAQTTENGDLLSLRYIHSDGTMLEVKRATNGFNSTEQQTRLERQVLMKSGEIKNSLFGATDAVNLPDAIAMQMADMFSTDVDFHLDLRKGDRFTVVYESFYNNGEFIKTGKILAAEFTNQGKTYRAVYFEDKLGHSGYYTPEGKSLRKAFLRSPLEFSRISSGFSTARFHPVLQTWRAHKGIDYAAPTGTRIKAVADGSIAFAGKENGYGNFILLQHQGKYSTAYGHLSGFAKGIHRGSKVSQGDVIGYVGMTGLATGPHLHYEFRVAGVQQNPLSVGTPVAFPIAAQYKHEFDASTRPLMSRLALIRGANLASLD